MANPKKISEPNGTREEINTVKTLNGKVNKRRVNNTKSNKSESLLIKSSNQRKNESASLKTRPCFVKLQRVVIDSCKSNDNDTLRAQCKKHGGITNKAQSKDKPEAKPMTKILQAQRKGLNVDNEYKKLDNTNDYNQNTSNIDTNTEVITQDRQQSTQNYLSCETTNKYSTRSGKVLVNSTKAIKHLPLKGKNFVIRVKKIGLDSASSNPSFSVPVIDDIKRNNFRKLSLTQPRKKLSESIEITEVKNSSHQKEIHDKLIGNKNTETLTESTMKSMEKSNLTKRNKFACIKQISRLSLKRRDLKTNKKKSILDNSQFESQKNSTICCESGRNSTLLDQGNANDDTKTTLPSKDRSSPRNLANKYEEIENLLNSLDDEEEILLDSPESKNDCTAIGNICNQNIETQSNVSSFHNKRKFFHHKKDVSKNISDEVQNTGFSKNKTVTKKKRFHTKRSTIKSRRESIYEFISRSQNSDSDIADPSADIIKKLIDQGKVRVATNYKGKGKPKFKRGKLQPKQMKQIKVNKKLKQLKNSTKKVTFTEETKGIPVEEDHNFIDHFDDYNDYNDDHNDDPSCDPNYNREIHRIDPVSNVPRNHNNRNVGSDQEGSFSSLAKSVLINQAARSDLQRRNLLLNKDFVSTPKNKKMPSPHTVDIDLSPIAKLPPATKATPWRVNRDAHLPTTFNFTRSSGNLPSFSSDFIPSTPTKNKSKVYLNGSYKIAMPSEKSKKKIKISDDIENIQLQRPNLSEPSEISSFSSNDSNAENMPPPKQTSEIHNENENIFDSKQLPNPRRALNHRSPLKTINILEVVHLPPYKHPNKINSTERNEMLSLHENLDDSFHEEDSISAEQQNHSLGKTEDLFGFEDYLSQTEFSSQDNQFINDTTTNGQNQTMHEKLQDLRKLKPVENELQKNVTNPIKTMPLFLDDDTKSDGMRQIGIKEMLCSTMLNPQPSTSKEALRQLNTRELKNSNKPRFREDLDPGELFKDPDPETTFNESEAHRTYIRPRKRKRRLKENKYVVYLQSDESEDEDNSHDKQKGQHSKESNSSSELAQTPKKKRHRKEPKENPELTEFIEEFNKLCEDVDNYKLIVEKSGSVE